MAEDENPAGRLHHWLTAVRPQASANPHASAHVIWCQAWKIPDDAHAEAFRRGLDLMDAAEEARRRAENSARPIARHGLANFDQVQQTVQFFARLPVVTVQEFFGPLQDDGLLGLAMLATVLEEDDPTAAFTQEDQKSLLDQVRALVDAVLAEQELPDAERSEVLEHLRLVEDAIVRVTVGGKAEVQRRTDGLFGLLMRMRLRGSVFTARSLGLTTWRLVVALDLALNGGANLAELASSGLGEAMGLPSGLGDKG